MEKKMDAKRIFVIAIMTVGLIIVNAYLGGCDENGLKCEDGTCDGDTDADADSDTDSDTDADTDSDTEVDPHACDCLNGESNEEGCVDIEGDWYAYNYCCEADHLLTVILTPLEVNCKIEFTGDAFSFFSFETKTLPTSFVYEEEDITLELSIDEYDRLIQKKTWNASGDDGFSAYERCDC